MFPCLFLWNNVSGRILYVIPLIPKYVVFIVQPNTNTIMILFLSSQKLQYRSRIESQESRIENREMRSSGIFMSLNQRFIYRGKNNYHSHAIISCLQTRDPRRRSTLQCVVFALNEKNDIDYVTRIMKHNKFIYKLVCRDARVPIVLYPSTNWLHRLCYGIYDAANYKYNHFKRANMFRAFANSTKLI